MKKLILLSVIVVEWIYVDIIFAQNNKPYYINTSSIDLFLKDPSLKSTKNRKIPLTQIKISKTIKYKFYIQGCLHANELTACEFVTWLANKIRNGNSLLNQLTAAQFDFVPIANPDGFVLKQRYNFKGVNLNRNFSMFWGISFEPHGIHPFSEKETLALNKLLTYQKYDAAIDVHGFTNLIVTPSITPELEKNSLLTPKYFSWIKILKAIMQKILWSHYKIKSALDLKDGGAFEDWAFWQNNTLAFCLELNYKNRFINNEDTFLRYEYFIYQIFKQLINNQDLI